jgi:hypothetical protein
VLLDQNRSGKTQQGCRVGGARRRR